MAGLIVFNCSGLSFPIIYPRADLNRRLERDFSVRLPDSAAVDQSSRVAYLDSSRVYSLHMAPADAVTFMARLSASAVNRGYTVDPEAGPASVNPPFGPPAWWRPQLWSDARYVRVTTDGKHMSQFDYGAAYSPSTGRVYLYRGEM